MTHNYPIFLTADWRYLAMLNYEIDPEILARFVPAGTELDSFGGRTYVSMAGFLFLNTRVLGIPIPWHRNFEEVNLRFYVRRNVDGEYRRGVVFVRELVPRRAIAWTANVIYGENYAAVPMAHAIERDASDHPVRVSYSWHSQGRNNCLSVETSGIAAEPVAGSLAEFITEHYWGYARQRNGGTVEYEVQHPRWRVWTVSGARFDCDVARFYGDGFSKTLSASPASAFLADGSAVTVSRGVQLIARPTRSALNAKE